MPKSRYDVQDKLKVLKLLQKGVSKKSLSELLNIERREITIWDLRYKLHGEEGLKPKFKRTIPESKKREIVSEYLAGGVSMRELCARHEICLASFKKWRKQYKAEV